MSLTIIHNDIQPHFQIFYIYELSITSLEPSVCGGASAKVMILERRGLTELGTKAKNHITDGRAKSRTSHYKLIMTDRRTDRNK